MQFYWSGPRPIAIDKDKGQEEQDWQYIQDS